MFMVLPGIGELYVNARTRLIFSLSLSLLFSTIIENLPAIPERVDHLFFLLTIEVMIGVFIGTIVRFLVSTLHIVGIIVGMQSGLGSAMLFDPNQGAQGSMIGSFIGMLAITLLFASDLHHLLFKGVIDSYQLFVPGKAMILGDVIDSLARLASDGFNVAIKIAAPQIAIGLLLLLGSGVLARLTPSLQIFFLITPVQLLISFFILMVTLSASMAWYLDYVSDSLKYILYIE